MSITLSICIPTYNRAAFIGATLESIISQATDEVEIVVSDNASSDNTKDVVLSYQKQFPRITYFRWEENMGADRNFLKVIELAVGKYCWFLGSDDQIEKDGINYVLEALAKNIEVTGLTVNYSSYEVTMTHRVIERFIFGPGLDGGATFSEAEDCFLTLSKAWGYISAHIFSRQIWNQIVADQNLNPYLNGYVHVYIFAKMVLQKPRWIFIDKICVGWRSGNDSFATEGKYQRLALDVVGYEKILSDVFGKGSRTYDEFNKIVLSVFVYNAVCYAKFRNEPASFFLKVLKICLKYYWKYEIFWLKYFPILGIFILVPTPTLLRLFVVLYKINSGWLERITPAANQRFIEKLQMLLDEQNQEPQAY